MGRLVALSAAFCSLVEFRHLALHAEFSVLFWVVVGIPVDYCVLVVKAPFSGGSTALRLRDVWISKPGRCHSCHGRCLTVHRSPFFILRQYLDGGFKQCFTVYTHRFCSRLANGIRTTVCDIHGTVHGADAPRAQIVVGCRAPSCPNLPLFCIARVDAPQIVKVESESLVNVQSLVRPGTVRAAGYFLKRHKTR